MSASCQQIPEKEKVSAPVTELSPQTFILEPASNKAFDRELVVPRGAVELLKVGKNTVEVREGPGTQFAIQDQFLGVDDILIVTGRLGVWVKFLGLHNGRSGWIHRATANEFVPQTSELKVDMDLLPVVNAVRRVNRIYSYQDQKKHKVDIPKGVSLVALKRETRRILVWLPQNNTLAWVDGSDFQ